MLKSGRTDEIRYGEVGFLDGLKTPFYIDYIMDASFF